MSVELPQRDLEALHAETNRALDLRDHRELNVLGFGEVSIALGCPTADPVVVCKRLPPSTPAQLSAYESCIENYLDALAARNIEVVPTRLMSVQEGERRIGYLVQELLSADSIGDKVLRASQPDADHPFLIALAKEVAKATTEVSVDAQVTNWSWDGTTLTLLDVGTPFMWHPDGTLVMDLDPALAMLPGAVRSFAKKDLTKLILRWQDPRAVAVDVIANLYREHLNEWVEPAIAQLNATLSPDEPIQANEALVFYEEDKKTFPRLKKMQQVERAWRTKARRRRYDFFIAETTYS